MNTQILQNNDVENKQFAQNNNPNGLLAVGESVNSYVVKSVISINSSEAEIYLCEKDNRKYVLKYYLATTPKLQNIEKIKNFNNPDVVELYEYGELNGHFYAIIEYAAGGALDQKDENGNYKYLPVGEETAIQIVKEVVNAFNEIHKAGIIHRDIKPGNLFYKNSDGSNIIVGDFGISSYIDVEDGMSKHLTQTFARTEGYASPEIYSGLIGPEIDYYSLGVTLWELLTAKNPCMTVDEKPMFPADVIKQTTTGKIVDTLLIRAPYLSKKMRTLIKGLMTKRHDKRWDYEKVTKFLNGEDVPIYSEPNQLPAVKIGNTECTSYKEISEALMANRKIGKDFIFKGKLPEYLAKIDIKLAETIADKIDEFSANGNYDEGLFYIVYKFDPDLGFEINSKKIISVMDLIDLLKDEPMEVLPYIMNENKDFYLYFKIIGAGETLKKIWEIASSSSDEYLIVPRILMSLNQNSLSPFKDSVNSNVTLINLKHLSLLPERLKERFLLLIDAYDKNVCAWVENVSGKKIKDWRDAYSIVRLSDENASSRWKSFNLFLGNDSDSSEEGIDISHILDNLSDLKKNQKYKMMAQIIDRTTNKLYECNNYKDCMKILEYLNPKLQSELQKPLNVYYSQKGICQYKANEYDSALNSFTTAEQYDRNDFNAQKFSALCYINKKDYKKAINKIDNAIKLQPDDYDLYEIKGNIHFELKDFKEAVALYTMVIEHKEIKSVYEKRADCYEELSKNGAPELMERAKSDRRKAANLFQL